MLHPLCFNRWIIADLRLAWGQHLSFSEFDVSSKHKINPKPNGILPPYLFAVRSEENEILPKFSPSRYYRIH